MSTIIRTRSPFFIRTPGQGSPNLYYFQITISVHSGVLDSVPKCDSIYQFYSLKKKPIGTETSVSFDISELVNDAIIQIYNANYSTSAITQSVWVSVVTSARTSAGAMIETPTTTSFLAQEGYNKFKDGANYTVEPYAMISSNYYDYKLGEPVIIPVNNELVNSVEWKFNSTILLTQTFSDNGNQNQKIRYAAKGTSSSNYPNELKVIYSGGSKIIKLNPIEECKYKVYKIVFLNRWGAFQELFFFKKSIETLSATREQFNASIFEARSVLLGEPESGEGACDETVSFNTYSTTNHSKKTFNSNATESILLNSGFVNELTNPYFEELLVSEYVWLQDLSPLELGESIISRIFPVNLKESSFTRKTGLNDKLINYTMSFEKSFNLVNNIR